MCASIERLVRLLDAAERRAARAEETIQSLQVALMDRPHKPLDGPVLLNDIAGVARGNKINAIRIYRQCTGASLIESKHAIESAWPVAAAT